mmetsp:Transcript_12101/g.12474  ORF Transcript_12101/g.12474 Transcript_12101/m.12474 type:complete len:361 (-) Transcript_12101:1262-2344(-)
MPPPDDDNDDNDDNDNNGSNNSINNDDEDDQNYNVDNIEENFNEDDNYDEIPQLNENVGNKSESEYDHHNYQPEQNNEMSIPESGYASVIESHNYTDVAQNDQTPDISTVISYSTYGSKRKNDSNLDDEEDVPPGFEPSIEDKISNFLPSSLSAPLKQVVTVPAEIIPNELDLTNKTIDDLVAESLSSLSRLNLDDAHLDSFDEQTIEDELRNNYSYDPYYPISMPPRPVSPNSPQILSEKLSTGSNYPGPRLPHPITTSTTQPSQKRLKPTAAPFHPSTTSPHFSAISTNSGHGPGYSIDKKYPFNDNIPEYSGNLHPRDSMEHHSSGHIISRGSSGSVSVSGGSIPGPGSSSSSIDIN